MSTWRGMLMALICLSAGCSLHVNRGTPIPMFVSDEARQVAKLVNRYRARNGLSSLEWDSYIYLVCLSHCEDMRERGYFSHYTPEYLSPFDRLELARVTYDHAGENLAHGQLTPEKVLSDWLHSPAHKRNIESVLFTHHAVAYDPEGHFWTHMFIDYGTGGYFEVTGFRAYRITRHRNTN